MSAIADFLSALETNFSVGLLPIAVKLIGDGESLSSDAAGSVRDAARRVMQYRGAPRSAYALDAAEPRSASGDHRGATVGLLSEGDFVPDVVVIFCNSRDAMRLMTAMAWVRGVPPGVNLAARGVCSDGIVQALLTGEPAVAVACGPDHHYSGTTDDELVFVAPLKCLESITAGLDAMGRILSSDRTADLPRG